MGGTHVSLQKRTRFFQKPLLFSSLPTPINHESKGVVYTKRWVAELLLDLAGYRSNRNLVDSLAIEPAAGNGAFLGPMIKVLLASCRNQGRPVLDCKGSLIAFELDPISANRARSIALETLTGCGVTESDAEILAAEWVRNEDYLLEADLLTADFVIGNPPYVRLEDIPETTVTLYRHAYPTMRGRADLYVAFFEAALSQLKKDGVCAFICADRWMRNQYGAELRRLITSAYSVDVVIEMHSASAFHDEVDAYPAITVIRRQRQENTVVAAASPDAAKTNTQVLTDALLSTRQDAHLAMPRGLKATGIKKWFEGSGPWPCNSPEQLRLLRKLEDQFEALECRAKVGIGVATGNDDVFITKDTHRVESSRLIKLALASDISSGTLEWSGHYLIDPWSCSGLVDLREYPLMQAYFENHAAALKRRHTAKNSKVGWYKTIDRVSHALSVTPKLYIADIKNFLDPVLDRGETYPHHNLYFIQSEQWDLEVLGGLLFSQLGHFFVASYGVRMRGGYWRFQAQYLRRIRVPAPAKIPDVYAAALRQAFRARDRNEATRAALAVYGVSQDELETAVAEY